MEKLGDYVKQSVLNFKLDLCCFVASVRAGLMMLSCANVVLGFITLIALAEETFEPILQQALESVSGDDGPDFKPTCIIAYAVELASSSMLVCAVLRNDLVLLRVFLYYSFGVITAAIMVYSVIFFSMTVGLKILILTSVGYQGYLILLVRSIMVEIKQASVKNGYTVNLKTNDIESPLGTEPREKYSVVIESDRIKKAPVTSLVKGDTHKAVLSKETEAKAGIDKEATLPVHLATRHEVTAKAGPTKEVTAQINLAKEDTGKAVPTKEVTAPIKLTKEATDKAAPTSEVKKEEIKKPSRSFFGRKEKVKIEDSKAKLEKIEESKKV